MVTLSALAALAGACGEPSAGRVATTRPVTTAVARTTAAVATTTTRATARTTSTAPVSTTTTASTTTTTTATTRLAPTTTRPWAPAAPAPTSSQAAYDLVDAWGNHDRAQALRDASPAAVAALFSYPYPSGGPQFRGCSVPPGTAPASCAWRSGNDLLALTAKQFARGWGIIAAAMET